MQRDGAPDELTEQGGDGTLSEPLSEWVEDELSAGCQGKQAMIV